MQHPTFSALSPARQRLVSLCSRIGFGRIDHLHLQGGEPVFDPAPIIVTERKLGTDQVPSCSSKDFHLKPAVIDLLKVLDDLGNGLIQRLEIRNGLPFLIELQGELAA